MGIHDGDDIRKELMATIGIGHKEYVETFTKLNNIVTENTLIVNFFAILNITASIIDSFHATQDKERSELLKKLVKAKFDL